MELTASEEKIVNTVESLTDEILDFTSALVSEKSTLGNEAGAVAVMEERLNKLGFSPWRIPIDHQTLREHPGYAPVPWEGGDKDNVAAMVQPETFSGRSLLFNGHLDVVSADPVDFWEQDPYTPEIRGNWLYGRGSGDMKSGVAAMTYAVHAVERAGFRFTAPVTIEGVIEEECCGNGALACIHQGLDADAVLIPEPFGPTIQTCQVGVLWFRVRVKGKPVHVLEAGAGSNAIEKLFPLIQALRELENEMNRENVPEAYRLLDHPLNLNIGIIQGGEWTSTVPAAGEFQARLSYYPGTDYQAVCRKIQQTVHRAAEKDAWLKKNSPEVEFFGFRSDGHCVSRDLPAFSLLNDCHKTFAGEDARDYISTCTTDLRAFHFFGNGQATCFGPAAENIHGANERVHIDSVIHTAKTYALFAARWCGITE